MFKQRRCILIDLYTKYIIVQNFLFSCSLNYENVREVNRKWMEISLT